MIFNKSWTTKSFIQQVWPEWDVLRALTKFPEVVNGVCSGNFKGNKNCKMYVKLLKNSKEGAYFNKVLGNDIETFLKYEFL